MVAVTTRAEKSASMWACGRCGPGSGDAGQTWALLLAWGLHSVRASSILALSDRVYWQNLVSPIPKLPDEPREEHNGAETK